jgi:hypothetical protein
LPNGDGRGGEPPRPSSDPPDAVTSVVFESAATWVIG